MLRRFLFILLLPACQTAGDGTSGSGYRPDKQPAQTPDSPDELTETPPNPDARQMPPAMNEPVDKKPIIYANEEPPGLNGPDAARAGETFTLRNTGSAPLTATVSTNDAWLSLQPTSVEIPAGGSAQISVTANVGDSEERIYAGSIRATDNTRTIDIPAYAVVADPALPSDITFTENRWGFQAMRGLPKAPWPQTSAANEYLAYVHMALPKDFRKTARFVDVEIALHGHNGNVSDTVVNKKYTQHAYYSNRNAVLIVPQGVYMQAHDDFGRLRQAGGVQDLVNEVLIVLYRARLIDHPVPGRIAISGHSGAYNSLSTIVGINDLAQVVLLDALYGAQASFRAWANTQSGQLISAFQSSTGNTPTANSLSLASQLESDGLPVTRTSRRPLPEDVAGSRNLFHTTYAAHDQVPTRHYNLGEFWRNSALRPKDPPRPIIRQARHDGGNVIVDAYVEPGSSPSLRLYISPDGVTFTKLGDGATLPCPNGVWLRATTVYPGFGESGASDTYFVRSGPGRSIVVVDAFDRMFDGEMTQDTHDFSARVGAATRDTDSVRSCADEAVENGTCSLDGADVVIWNAGLSSSDNPPIDAPGRDILSSYLGAGGHLIANGAELGYALADSFLSGTLEVSNYSASTDDDAGSSECSGLGASTFSFGGATSYAVEFPDVFRGDTVLSYGNGKSAGIVTGRVASVGFPLETIDDAATRSTIVRALIDALF